MDVVQAFITLAISGALGLLVGVQRERADSALAGIRTFPLITLFGTVCGMLSEPLGGWIVAAGLLGVAIATAMGNFLRTKPQESPGITTEIAILLMYVTGAFIWLGPRPVAVGVGVACVVLLHAKAFLHNFAGRMGEHDMRAIIQFALITFIVLPVLPNERYPPFGAINPREIWLMVVLVTGISLTAYVVAKLLPKEHGAAAAGLIGGLISSTATTVTAAKRVRKSPSAAWTGVLIATLASVVSFGRVLVEIFVAAPGKAAQIAPMVGVLLGAALVASAVAYLLSRKQSDGHDIDPGNPSELKAALVFGALYAVVLVAVAAGEKWLGNRGLYIVAAISGLTDMDAITLSTSRMAARDGIDTGAAWRAIVIASLANLVFKAGIVAVVGGRAIFVRLLPIFGIIFSVGVVLLVGAALFGR
jgi:uncharacterized membrane protein (DUF4010 family)